MRKVIARSLLEIDAEFELARQRGEVCVGYDGTTPGVMEITFEYQSNDKARQAETQRIIRP